MQDLNSNIEIDIKKIRQMNSSKGGNNELSQEIEDLVSITKGNEEIKSRLVKALNVNQSQKEILK